MKKVLMIPVLLLCSFAMFAAKAPKKYKGKKNKPKLQVTYSCSNGVIGVICCFSSVESANNYVITHASQHCTPSTSN